MLFDGRHREYYLDEGRTQFSFPQVRVSSGTATAGRASNLVQLYLTYNVLGLISLKSADLLFGEEPLLRARTRSQQQALSGLAERCNLHSLLHAAAVDASYQAECFLECVRRGRGGLPPPVPADEIFPLGELGPDLQYDAYVRYSLQNVGTEQAKIWLLLETQYREGSIERHAYQLDDDGRGGMSRREVALDQWPLPAGADPLVPVQPTRIDRNTITWVPNLLVRGKPVADYDGAIDLQDALNAKNSQLGRVLLKHSDPKMGFPEEAFDQDGNIRSDYNVFPFSDPEKIPKYITWDAQLAAAMQDRAFVLNQLLVRTETSPVLLGLKEGAAPDAYKKVRLESFNSLTKAARKAAYWKAGIRRAVSVAQDLEQTLPGVRYDRSPIGVELRDGIPKDDLEEAQVISLLLPVGAMSRERAIQLQLNDPAAVEKELAAVEAEKAAAAPSILMQEPPSDVGATPASSEIDCRTGGGRMTLLAVACLVSATCSAHRGLRVVPEFSPSGVSQRELDALVKLYTDAQDRLKAIVLNPQGRTQGPATTRSRGPPSSSSRSISSWPTSNASATSGSGRTSPRRTRTGSPAPTSRRGTPACGGRTWRPCRGASRRSTGTASPCSGETSRPTWPSPRGRCRRTRGRCSA
jgi:hypothetical protein